MASSTETGPPVGNGADKVAYLEKVFFRIASGPTIQLINKNTAINQLYN